MNTFVVRLLARIRSRHFDTDLAEELRFHEEMKRQELETAGLAPADARAAARRALGNTTLKREDSRAVWVGPWLESLVQDVRYAVRTLARRPLHTTTGLAVLVVGIGLNTSLFTFFKAMRSALRSRRWTVGCRRPAVPATRRRLRRPGDRR